MNSLSSIFVMYVDNSRFDFENILTYNVGVKAFRKLHPHHLVMERSFNKPETHRTELVHIDLEIAESNERDVWDNRVNFLWFKELVDRGIPLDFPWPLF